MQLDSGTRQAGKRRNRIDANNRVALVIPCHRVVRGDGDLGGYRWGRARKEKLLAAEGGE